MSLSWNNSPQNLDQLLDLLFFKCVLVTLLVIAQKLKSRIERKPVPLLHTGVYAKFTYMSSFQANNSIPHMKVLVTSEKPTSSLKYWFATVGIISCH